jgi:hypothetical protein
VGRKKEELESVSSSCFGVVKGKVVSLSLLRLPTLGFASGILRFRPDSTRLTRELVEINDAIGIAKSVVSVSLWTQYLGILRSTAFGDASVFLSLR